MDSKQDNMMLESDNKENINGENKAFNYRRKNQFRNDKSMDSHPKKNFRPRKKGFKVEGSSEGTRNPEERLMDRIQQIRGPTFDLTPLDMTEKKFSGNNRLFIGNLSPEMTEEDLLEMFKPFGETSEIFVNKEKNFGFVRLDYHCNAEKAQRELDGTLLKGRTVKIRFAPNGATIKVKNLTQWVTNELLFMAFSMFGEIERCVIITDDRGKTSGEGIVEFSRKMGAQSALKHCTENCFFLTASLRPVIVETYEQMNTSDGYPERNLFRRTEQFHEARSVGPRFAVPGSFEYEYGTRWKQLHELYKQKQLALNQELAMEEEKLEAQMKYAKFDAETEKLREQLRVREIDRERKKREWEERERLVEEQRRRHDEQLRIQQEELEKRIRYQEENMRRRQEENSLFMQAQQLDNILDQQEQVIQNYSTNEYDLDSKDQIVLDSYNSNENWNNYTKRRRY